MVTFTIVLFFIIFFYFFLFTFNVFLITCLVKSNNMPQKKKYIYNGDNVQQLFFVGNTETEQK